MLDCLPESCQKKFGTSLRIDDLLTCQSLKIDDLLTCQSLRTHFFFQFQLLLHNSKDTLLMPVDCIIVKQFERGQFTILFCLSTRITTRFCSFRPYKTYTLLCVHCAYYDGLQTIDPIEVYRDLYPAHQLKPRIPPDILVNHVSLRNVLL